MCFLLACKSIRDVSENTCAAAFIWYTNSNTLLIYYVGALSRLDYFSHQAKGISFMWGPYLVHKQILIIIDKQLEHAVDYFK